MFLLRCYDRRSYARPAQFQYVEYPRAGYHPRVAGAEDSARRRFAISPSWETITGEARPRVRARQGRGLCPWMLLAHARVQVREAEAGNEYRFLGTEAPVERGAG